MAAKAIVLKTYFFIVFFYFYFIIFLFAQKLQTDFSDAFRDLDP